MAAPPINHQQATVMNPITSMNEPWPSPEHLAAATTTHRQGPFAISSRKLPISKAGPIEAMEKAIGIPVPEMIFGDNLVSIAHMPSGWRIEFNARDALDAVDKTGNNMLQVAYAGEWSASREQTSAGIREVVRPFDWSYSTTYKGTVVTDERTKTNSPAGTSAEQSSRKLAFAPTDTPIPIELLKRRDPIRFFDDVMLYESELDDNGISVLSAKFRVHDERMLLLCRLYMRLDNVVCRVRDTRVYVDFASEVITREYTVKEASFSDVKQKLLLSGLRPDAITVALRDANSIAEILPIVDGTLESVSLAS
ncbi:TIP41-like family-domain-containing protein [Xylaria bambusicola]|uniref:TIP41-like family-domain-containing protein n=1 Tax=Xylaria bambusicola TaxID=326684 RepID=UPI002008423C|nr:TIP41-like family-domain-containing protein [Xylaria bambusicola]KAI0527813.1 TIP41-like family-domain-containing protein [Xylaria bambusicola]